MSPHDVAKHLLELAGAQERSLLAISEESAGRSPGPETWSRKQILGHLIDSAANNHQRFIRLQQESELKLPGYDQNSWVRLNHYAARPWSELVALWAAYNRHLAHVIAGIEPETLGHIWDNGGERHDLAFIVTDYLAHLRHHLEQIERG